MSAGPYLGAILCFPFIRSISNYAVCLGQSIPVSQNQALLAVIGTLYGGDGSVSFNLPDLSGRVPVGRASSGSFSMTGLACGSPAAVLSPAQLPPHTHPVEVMENGATLTFRAAASAGTTNIPSNTTTIAQLSTGSGPSKKTYNIYAPAGTPSAGHIPAVLFGNTMLQNTGSNKAFSLLQPTMVLNYQIAIQGVFPTSA